MPAVRYGVYWESDPEESISVGFLQNWLPEFSVGAVGVRSLLQIFRFSDLLGVFLYRFRGLGDILSSETPNLEISPKDWSSCSVVQKVD